MWHIFNKVYKGGATVINEGGYGDDGLAGIVVHSSEPTQLTTPHKASELHSSGLFNPRPATSHARSNAVSKQRILDKPKAPHGKSHKAPQEIRTEKESHRG